MRHLDGAVTKSGSNAYDDADLCKVDGHGKKVLDYSCRSCKKPFCPDFMILDLNHANQEVVTIASKAEKVK